jgi:hypothetical protein
MTCQEAYDKVVEHFVDNMQPKSVGGEWTSDAESISCAYRGKGGAKCAFGVLIPDEVYTNTIEGNLASTLIDELKEIREVEELELPFDKWLLKDVINGEEGLVSVIVVLQSWHDSCFSNFETGAERLRRINRYLKTSILEMNYRRKIVYRESHQNDTKTKHERKNWGLRETSKNDSHVYNAI